MPSGLQRKMVSQNYSSYALCSSTYVNIPVLFYSTVLSAYVFYTLNPAYYQLGTSYIKATSLATNMAAGIVGDLLVVEGDVSLRILMWISAVSVCIGFIVGVMVIQAPHVHTVTHNTNTKNSTNSELKHEKTNIAEESNITDIMNPIGDISFHSTIDSPTSSSKHGFLNETPTTHNNNNPNTTTDHTPPHLTVSDKLRLFKEQLVFLRLAFRSRTLTALVLYWVMGNAVFMVSTYIFSVFVCIEKLLVRMSRKVLFYQQMFTIFYFSVILNHCFSFCPLI